jgi:hypothetical protein
MNWTPERTEKAVINASDAAIVRSLLRKSQSLTLQLAEDAANMGVTGAKRMRPKDRAQKIKLLHCYVTVAIRYMVKTHP